MKFLDFPVTPFSSLLASPRLIYGGRFLKKKKKKFFAPLPADRRKWPESAGIKGGSVASAKKTRSIIRGSVTRD